jgi:hypothetical protein
MARISLAVARADSLFSPMAVIDLHFRRDDFGVASAWRYGGYRP